MDSSIEHAREILRAEADAINNIPISESFSQAIEAMYNCKGKIITTGMGKAGNIAQKVAGTLCSTGTPAVYLHPGESEHGDLGLISAGDVILAFSTSGKTREVIEMLSLARNLGLTSAIGITSHPDSRMRDLCEIIIDMGDIKEPCPLGLTPTSTTTVMLALGDALSLVLMKKKQFTREEYGLRHHGGYLGTLARTPHTKDVDGDLM